MGNGMADQLMAAAAAGDLQRVRSLLPPEGAAYEDEADPGTGLTPLMAVAATGHTDVVELLLARGADPSRRDQHGRSAAAHARAGGHPHLAQRLDTVVDQEKTIW